MTYFGQHSENQQKRIRQPHFLLEGLLALEVQALILKVQPLVPIFEGNSWKQMCLGLDFDWNINKYFGSRFDMTIDWRFFQHIDWSLDWNSD